MTVMSFKEYNELDEAWAQVGMVALRLGKEIVKLAGPPLSIKSAVKGTVIYSIATKYDLTAIIKLQSLGVGLIIDVGKWLGIEIAPKVAAAIFGRIAALGAVTLGAILLSVIAVKNPKKAKSIYNKAIKVSKNVKSKLTRNDIKKIGKELKAAQ